MDPSTTLPTPFALVTYSQAICAARCVTALNNYVVDAVECVAFVVKVIYVQGVCFVYIVFLGCVEWLCFIQSLG